jgi:hypothetical protein
MLGNLGECMRIAAGNPKLARVMPKLEEAIGETIKTEA